MDRHPTFFKITLYNFGQILIFKGKNTLISGNPPDIGVPKILENTGALTADHPSPNYDKTLREGTKTTHAVTRHDDALVHIQIG